MPAFTPPWACAAALPTAVRASAATAAIIALLVVALIVAVSSALRALYRVAQPQVVARRRREPPLGELSFDESDGVADSEDPVHVLVAEVQVELLLQEHRDLHPAQAVELEILAEAGLIDQEGGIFACVTRDDFLHARRY